MTTLAAMGQFWAISDTLATAGQPTEAEFAALALAGYEVVINLALPTSDQALPDEQTTVFVYLYRVLKLGIDPALAQRDLFAIWQPNDRWQGFIDQAMDALP